MVIKLTPDSDGRTEVDLNEIIGDMDNFELKIPFLAKVISELYEDDKGSIDLSSHREATVALKWKKAKKTI